MKIVPGQGDGGPRPRMSQAAAEGDAFVRALAQRAAGFAELGLFGRAASPSADPSESTASPRTAAPCADAPGRACPPEAAPPTDASVCARLGAHSGLQSSTAPGAAAVHAQPKAVVARVAAEGQAATQPTLSPDAECEPPVAPAPQRPAPTRRPASQGGGPRLLLVEKDGQVELVAAAPDVAGGGAAARLRGVLARILAGHGLLLTEFRLNGTAVRADVINGKDGSNGPRSH